MDRGRRDQPDRSPRMAGGWDGRRHDPGSVMAVADRVVRAQEGSGTSVARWIRDTSGGFMDVK